LLPDDSIYKLENDTPVALPLIWMQHFTLQHEKVFGSVANKVRRVAPACAAPMTIQLALGIMNPLIMIIVATFIAAEKLFAT
jgi:hypothetical protein